MKTSIKGSKFKIEVKVNLEVKSKERSKFKIDKITYSKS